MIDHILKIVLMLSLFFCALVILIGFVKASENSIKDKDSFHDFNE